METFSTIPARCGGLYPVLPDCWDAFECPYLLSAPLPLVLSYYCGSYFCGGPDNIRRIFSSLSCWAVTSFTVCRQEVAPDYIVGP